jgi:hypothetical protein
MISEAGSEAESEAEWEEWAAFRSAWAEAFERGETSAAKTIPPETDRLMWTRVTIWSEVDMDVNSDVECHPRKG